jgi:ribosomal RNA-processing protein 8
MTKSKKKRLRESAGAAAGARASPEGVEDKVTATTAASAKAKATAKAKAAVSPPSIQTFSTPPAKLGGSVTPSSASTNPGGGRRDNNNNRDDDRETWSKSKKKRMRKKEAAMKQSNGGGSGGGGGRTDGPPNARDDHRDDGGPDETSPSVGSSVRDGGRTTTTTAAATCGPGGGGRSETGIATADGGSDRKERPRKDRDPEPSPSAVSRSSLAVHDNGGGKPKKKEGMAQHAPQTTRNDNDAGKSASNSGAKESSDADRIAARADAPKKKRSTPPKIGPESSSTASPRSDRGSLDDGSGDEPIKKEEGRAQRARPSTTLRDEDNTVQKSASKSKEDYFVKSPERRSGDVDRTTTAARTDEVGGSPKKKRKKKKKSEGGASSPSTTAGPKDLPPGKGRRDADAARDEIDDGTGRGEPPQPVSPRVKISLPKPSQMSTLQRDFLERLTSSRFRELNEELYTHTSGTSFERFTSSPELFDQYHVGFRKQAESWPVNPVDVIYKKIVGGWTRDRQGERSGGGGVVEKTNGGGTKKTVIADFGCGDAKLAEKLLALRIGKDGKTLAQASTKKTASCCPFEVYSFDLVSGGNPLVTPADMANVPLPDEAVDVAVFSLALMGTNVADFVREAWRVLRFNGVLRVAEVRSRFETASGGTPDEEDETNIKRGKSNNGKRHRPAKVGGGNRANKRNPTDDGGGDAPPQPLMLLDDFVSMMERCGFQCTFMDRSNKMFLFMDFLKLDGSTGVSDKERFTAKACIYKKR